MELSTIRTPSLVVALDIGSTYSGYAWQWRRDGDNLSNVEFNTSWGVGSLQLMKTSTCLLLKENEEVDSFGYQAEKRYCNYKTMESTSPDSGIGSSPMYFFRHFKLGLYNKTNTNELNAEPEFGPTFSLMTVMSKFIGALKDHFLTMMKNKNQNVDLRRTLWVITVPAIWTEQARSFMRTAAIESGIDKYNILVALEPEVASIYCLHQMPHIKQFGEKGNKFVTVDLGGGTVDITAFEVLEDGFLKELCVGTGSRVGGQDINVAFFQNWQEAFNARDWSEISGRHSYEDILTMEIDFERNKVELGSAEEIDEHINLAIPDTTREMLRREEVKLKDSEEVREFFKMERGKFMFNPRLVRNRLFKVTNRRIIETIEDILNMNELQDVQNMVFVGGFSESKIVIDEIESVLREKYPRLQFVTPTSPFRAVLAGAVLYGHNPLIFRSRISRKTYGIRTSAFFDPEKHDPSRVYEDPKDGEQYIRGIFDVHVRKGSVVSLNDEHPPVIYYPKRPNARVARIRIYSSEKNDPQYISDAECEQEGEIIVDLPETNDYLDRQIEVQMIYGGTQLHVIARERTSQSVRKFNATIKFD